MIIESFTESWDPLISIVWGLFFPCLQWYSRGWRLKLLPFTSIDPFLTFTFLLGNMVIEDAYERRYVEDKYFDIPLGYQIIRGDEICLLGEVVFPFTLSLIPRTPRTSRSPFPVSSTPQWSSWTRTWPTPSRTLHRRSLKVNQMNAWVNPKSIIHLSNPLCPFMSSFCFKHNTT